MVEYSGPQNTQDLNRQIEKRMEDLKELLQQMPDNTAVDNMTTTLFELESLLNWADIRLKPFPK